jgi:hypothetical protein
MSRGRKRTQEQKYEWMKARQQAPVLEIDPTKLGVDSIKPSSVSDTKMSVLVGIEPTMSFVEIMAAYGWKYHKVYRHFMDPPRLGVKFKYIPGKRPKRFYDVPVSVVKAEWDRIHSVNRHKADEWERLHPHQQSA